MISIVTYIRDPYTARKRQRSLRQRLTGTDTELWKSGIQISIISVSLRSRLPVTTDKKPETFSIRNARERRTRCKNAIMDGIADPLSSQNALDCRILHIYSLKIFSEGHTLAPAESTRCLDADTNFGLTRQRFYCFCFTKGPQIRRLL